jgi:surface protein
MKTLNEQIQRLRDILHTCYESIASKGGTLPPVGERNMTNLPDAVESVPQVISAELEELTITQNGEYLPSDGMDGFSKVTAEFDTSSLPKVKVSSFKVTNSCINGDGYWTGESIDTSAVTSLNKVLYNCSSAETLDVSGWDTSRVTNISEAFYNCSSLQNVRITSWDTSNVTNMSHMFYGCSLLQTVDVSNWNTENVTTISYIFSNCTSLHSIDLSRWNASKVTVITQAFSKSNNLFSLVGSRTIDEVISNNIGCLNGLKTSITNAFLNSNNINRASLRALINGLADLTGQSARILTLGATLLAKLTEEDIAIATNKNWTLS